MSNTIRVIPGLQQFRHERRWGAWLLTTPEGRDKPLKLPIGANAQPARANDPSTWLTLDEAIALWHRITPPGAQPGSQGGLAIFLGDGLAGVDLDTCVDGVEGMTPWSQTLVGALGFGAGAEISPSGTGVKIFMRYAPADLPVLRSAFRISGDRLGGTLWKEGTGKAHPPGIELYLGARFFALTGNELFPGSTGGSLPVLNNMVAGQLVVTVAALGGIPEEMVGVGGGSGVQDESDPVPLGAEESARRVAAARAAWPYLDATLRGDTSYLDMKATKDDRSSAAFVLTGWLKEAGLTAKDCEPILAGCGTRNISHWYEDQPGFQKARQVRRQWQAHPPAILSASPLPTKVIVLPAIPAAAGGYDDDDYAPDGGDYAEQDDGDYAPGAIPAAVDGAVVAVGGAGDDGAWLGQLQFDRVGYLGTVHNAALVMVNDEVLQGAFAYDEFANKYQLTRPLPSMAGEAPRPGPYPRSWTDDDITLLNAYLQRRWGYRFSRTATHEAMSSTAANTRRHPVREWLDGLQWDGVPRLDGWMASAFGCPDDHYHRAVGAKFMIAAVRRVRQPGCKFDYLPVLEGPQGIGKSRACAALFGDDWFTDHLPADISSKDASDAMIGVWGIELAEIEHIIRAESETMKAFLSRRVDRFRPAYGRTTLEFPRQSVMIGTTNQDDYLRDATGNRRIWPVKCIRADAAWVEQWRVMLWAEACVREATGENLWLGAEAESTANAMQSERMVEDVWEVALTTWLDLQPDRVITVAEMLHMGLGMTKERMSRREDMRAAAMLRKMGWERFIGRDSGGVVRRGWRRAGSAADWRGAVAATAYEPSTNVVPFGKLPVTT